MQRSQDIAHLYQGFGGQPEEYRELTRVREAEQAGARWPLISAVGALSVADQIPPVHAGEAAEQSQHAWHVMRPPVQTAVPAVPAAPVVQARTESWMDARLSPQALAPQMPAASLPQPSPQPSWAEPAAVAPAWSSPAPVGGAMPAPPPLMAAAVPPAPAAFWGAAPPVQPPPIAPTPPAAPVPPVNMVQGVNAGGVFDRPSPLTRLAQPTAKPAPSSAGLQQVFARLLGARGRS